MSKDIGRSPAAQGRAAAADAVEPVPVSSKASIPNAEERLLRVQTALERRVATYLLKQRLSDPLGDDDCNKHERYAFAVECFEVFAQEAGLEIPPLIYHHSEETGA
jgi:hypothetical protein